jgi:hypothetical protein
MSVRLSRYSVASRTYAIPGFPQGAKRTQVIALRGFLPPGSPPKVLPQWGSLPYVFAPFGLPHFGASSPIFATHHRTFPLLGCKPLGFYHIRLDHPGLGKTGTVTEGLGHSLGLASIGNYSPWEHRQLKPTTPAPSRAFNPWGFNTQVFSEWSPLRFLLQGFSPRFPFLCLAHLGF